MKSRVLRLWLAAAALTMASAACGSVAETATGATTVSDPAAPSSSSTSLDDAPDTHALQWATADLPYPRGELIGEVVDIAARSDGLTVLAYAKGAGLGSEKLLVWTSAGESDWTLMTPRGVELPGDARFLLLESGSAGYVGALRNEFGPGEPVTVWTSSDALTWRERDLPITVDEFDRFLIDSLVVSDDGMLVVGSLVTIRPDPAAGITKGGRSLTIDLGWTVTDDASGEVLGSGELSDVYPTGVDEAGVIVRDPVTNETIVVIPWEVYEAGIESTGVFTTRVDHQGWRLIEDSQDHSYVLVDIASGTEVVSGANRNYLTLGPDPVVELNDGTTFPVTWDELDAAWTAGITASDSLDLTEGDRSVIHHSLRGDEWTTANLAPGEAGPPKVDVYWAAPAVSGSGFVAVGSDRSATPVWTTWNSADGVSWQARPVDIHPGLYAEVVAAGGSEIVVAGSDGQARYITASIDGLAWDLVYEVEEEHLSEQMNDVAVGASLAAAVGESGSPYGRKAELFVRIDGSWTRADLPSDPFNLSLTQVIVTGDSVVLGGASTGGRFSKRPIMLVGTAP